MDGLANKRITVMGLGRFGGGIAAARWLCSQGARVLVTDREPADQLRDSIKQLDGLPIEFRLGEHCEDDFTGCDLLVTSPAVPPGNPFLLAAARANVPVSTEIRLFIERCPCRIIGVTATKGKSTTTALLGLMLKRKYTTWVGGNIGGSLLFDLPKMKNDDLVVLELSSYMLEHLRPMQWSPHVAVIGMISRDHLDWHGTVENYIDAKRNIVRFQKKTDYVLVNAQAPGSLEFAKHTHAQILAYGLKDRRPFRMRLAGEHNQLNAQAAFEAASIFGISWNDAQQAIVDFAGLPHRLQIVHESAEVQFVNDSIATIPEAAVAALSAFPEGKVIQIVGGHDKRLDLSGMCEALRKRAKAVLCIGNTGAEIQRQVGGKAELCGQLAAAVGRARELAGPGDVILLSPGCASYDQFDNFEQRGMEFAKLAREAGNQGTTRYTGG